MIAGLEVIPIRRALGLTEQPLRKNEKAGVGRAQIVLSQEHAAKIYAMRNQNPALPDLAREVAGKSTLVAEVFSVSPKTVRDIWGRKTWTQATRPLWTEQELAAHLGEHSRKQAVQLAAASAPKQGVRISTREAASLQTVRPRGRPPGSKDTRPRKRRLRPEEESQESLDDEMPQETFTYQEQLHGRNCPSAYTSPHLAIPRGIINTARMVRHCEQQLGQLERCPAPPASPAQHHESSQRRSLDVGYHGSVARPAESLQFQQAPVALQRHHNLHVRMVPPAYDSLRGGGGEGGAGMALGGYQEGFGGERRFGGATASFPPPLQHEGSVGALQHLQRLPSEEPGTMVCAPPEGDGDDYAAWAPVEVASGSTSEHASEDGGAAGGAWAYPGGGGAGWAGAAGYEEVWHAPPPVAEPQPQQVPQRVHGMTLRSALQPSSEPRMITEAAPPFAIRFVNEAWCDMCQYAVEEVGGATPQILQGPLTDKGTLKELVERLVLRNEEVTGTVINYKKSGEPFLNRLTMLPLYDDENNVSHYLGVLVDISG